MQLAVFVCYDKQGSPAVLELWTGHTGRSAFSCLQRLLYSHPSHSKRSRQTERHTLPFLGAQDLFLGSQGETHRILVAGDVSIFRCFHIPFPLNFRITAQDSNEIYHFFRGGPGLRDISVEDVPWQNEMHSPFCWFQQWKWFPWMEQSDLYWHVFQKVRKIKWWKIVNGTVDFMRQAVFAAKLEVIIYDGSSFYKSVVHVWDSSGFGAGHMDVQGSSRHSVCWVDTSLCFGTFNVDLFSPSPRSTKAVKACQKSTYKRKQNIKWCLWIEIL